MSVRTAPAREPLDRQAWQERRALDDFKRRCGEDFWCGRAIEALAGLAHWAEFIADFSDAANGDARLLDIPAARAKSIAEAALEAHVARARRYIDEMHRAVSFALPPARDAAARRVDIRFGSLLAPAVSRAVLVLHFGDSVAAERVRRWDALVSKMAAHTQRKRKAAHNDRRS